MTCYYAYDTRNFFCAYREMDLLKTCALYARPEWDGCVYRARVEELAEFVYILGAPIGGKEIDFEEILRIAGYNLAELSHIGVDIHPEDGVQSPYRAVYCRRKK